MIDSQRLILRPLAISDAEQLFSYRSDVHTNKYQSWIPGSIREVQDWINEIASDFNIQDTWFQIAIVLKKEEKMIGDLGIHFFGNENLQCELGITLAREQQSKGLATEAMTAVIDHLFNTHNKHRIIGSVDPKNLASIRLLKALGFRKEAHFVKSYFQNGQWTDDLVFGILKEEWKLT